MVGWRERLRTSLWLVPAASTLISIVAAKLLAHVDRTILDVETAWYLFGGQAESARSILSTIATAMMTFTALVFSVTILVLQLASTQFSPRVLRAFLMDRPTKVALGLFVGSFVYAMALLPEVRTSSNDDPGFVPALAVFTAFALVLVSVAVFVHYIHHMAQAIRASHVIASVGAETRRTLERMLPDREDDPASTERAAPSGPSRECAHDGEPGVIVGVHERRLVRIAREHDVVIALVPRVGEFVPRGAPLFRIHGESSLEIDDLRSCVEIGEERSPDQDPAFGFRQLVDVALRALSPGIHDPTTAVLVIDQLHDLLRHLATRPLPRERATDDDGATRAIVRRQDWDGLVRLALDEIRAAGSGFAQIVTRMRALLDDLVAIAPADRRAPLLVARRKLDAAAKARATRRRAVTEDGD